MMDIISVSNMKKQEHRRSRNLPAIIYWVHGESELEPSISDFESTFSSFLIPPGPHTQRSQRLSPQAHCNRRGWLHISCLASGQPSVGTQGCGSASQGLNSLCPQLLCPRGSQRIRTFLFVSTNFPDLSFSSSKRNRDHVGDHPKNALVSRGQCP